MMERRKGLRGALCAVGVLGLAAAISGIVHNEPHWPFDLALAAAAIVWIWAGAKE